MASFDQGPYYGLVWSRTLLRPRLIKDPITASFIVFSLKNNEKALVLLCFRSTSRIFSENPCAKMQKTQKC